MAPLATPAALCCARRGDGDASEKMVLSFGLVSGNKKRRILVMTFHTKNSINAASTDCLIGIDQRINTNTSKENKYNEFKTFIYNADI